MPDLFSCHTTTAVMLGPENLVDWNGWFTPEDLSSYVPPKENFPDISCVKVMLTGILLVLIGTFLYVADGSNMDAATFFFFAGIVVFVVGLLIPWDGRGKAVVNEDLPQRKCPRCGKKHDFDYPQCPHCGHDYTQRT